MELNCESLFIDMKEVVESPPIADLSTTSNNSINTAVSSRGRRVTKGSAIVLTSEKLLKYANTTSPITYPEQCTVVAKNHDAKARCIQRQWKHFRRFSEHLQKVNTSSRGSSSLSNKIFSLVLGWRVRSLMKSEGTLKQLQDLDELYRVLSQVAFLATGGHDKSSTVEDKRKAIILVQDMISTPNTPWTINTPTFRSYADRVLAETIVKDVLAKRRNIHELLFGDATWRRRGIGLMGYWDLSRAVCRLIIYASPHKDHLTARSISSLKSKVVTPKLDVSGMTSPSPAARRYDTSFSNSLELPSSDDLFGVRSDIKHEVSPLFLTMLLGESEPRSCSEATKVLPAVMPMATLDDAHTDLEESDDTVDVPAVPGMMRNGTISVVNHDGNGTGRLGVGAESGGLVDEIKQQLTTLRSKAVHGLSLASHRRRSVVGASSGGLHDPPPSVRQRRASMPLISYTHQDQSTALHASSSETFGSMQSEEKRKGGSSRSSIVLEILQADHLMPAKKGTIVRDKQGNIVPDRKPCLRVSMYLPTTTISTSLGRLCTSFIVDDEDNNNDDDDTTSRRNSRGTDSRQSNSSSMNSSSSSFVSRDLRKVHSTHRDFSELTLNPRWGSDTSTMDETDTEGGGDGAQWSDDKLQDRTVSKELSGQGRAVFELSLPCPRKVMQRAAQQYHADKLVSVPSSTSSASSSSRTFRSNGSGSGSALYDHACNALLEYWSHGVIKIQIVDGERFNEDIFLGEVTLPLSAFLVNPWHQSTPITTTISITHDPSGRVACYSSPSQSSPGLLQIAGTYPMSKIRPSDRVSGTLTLRAALRLPEPTYIADLFATATQAGPLHLPLRMTTVSKDRAKDEDNTLTRRLAPVRGRSHSQPSIRTMSSSLLHMCKEEDESPLNGFRHDHSQSMFDADDEDADNHHNTSYLPLRADGCEEGGSWDEDESDVLEVSFAPSSPKVTESPDRRRFRLRPAVSSFTLHGHHGTPGGGTTLDTEGATRCDIAMVKSRVRVRPTSMAVKDDEASAERSLSLSQTPASSSSSPHNAFPSSPTFVKRKEYMESHSTPSTSVAVAPTSGGTPSPSSFSRIPVLSSRKDRDPLHSNRSPNTAIGSVGSGAGASATGTLSPGYYRGSPGTSEKHNHSHSSISSSTASSSRTGCHTNNGHGTNLRRSMMADVSRCLDSLSIAQENADDVLGRLHRRLEERQQQRKITANKGDMNVSVSSADATTLPTDIDTTTLTCLSGDDCEASSSTVPMTLNNSLLGVVPVSSYHVNI